jgi:hypothetical protein
MDNNNPQMASRRSMLFRRVLAGLLLLALGIFFLCAGVLLYLRIGLNGDQAARLMIHRLGAATGTNISFSSAKLSWVSTDTARIVFNNLTFKENAHSPALLRVPAVTLELNALPALRGVLMINVAEFSRPDLVLVSSSTGSTSGLPTAWSLRRLKLYPFVKQLHIENGRVLSAQAEQPDSANTPVLSKLNLSATNLTLTCADSIHVSGETAGNGNVASFDISGRVSATPLWGGDWQGDATAIFSHFPILPLRVMTSHFGCDLPFSKGELNASVKANFQGRNMKLTGELELAQAVLMPGLIFVDNVPIDRGSVRFRAELEGDSLSVDLAEASIPGLKVTGQAKIGNIFSQDPEVKVSLKKADLDFKKFFPFIPLRLLKNQDRERLADVGLKGHLLIEGGTWSGKISSLATDWTGRGSLALDARLDRVSGFIPGFGLPVEDATGRIRLSAEELSFKGISFTLGHSPIVLNGQITDLKTSPKSDLFLSMTAQAQDLLPILENQAVSSRLKPWLGGISEPGGGVSITLDVKGNLNKPALNGRILFEDFQCNLAGIPFPLKKINGSLRFRGSKVSLASMKGTIGESPLEISGDIGQGGVSLSGDAKLHSADLKRLNVLPPQWLASGSIPVSMTLKGKIPDANFSIQADLKGNTLELGNWVRKRPGPPLSIELAGTRNRGITTIEEAYLVLGETRISGKATVSEDGRITASVNLPPKGIPTSDLIPYANPSLDLQSGGRLEGDAIIRTSLYHWRDANVDANLVLNHVSLHIPGFYKRTEGFTGTIRRRGKALGLVLERAKIGNSVLAGTLSLMDGDIPKLEVAMDFSFLDTTDFTAPPGYVTSMTWGEWIRSNPVVRFLARSRGSCTLKVAKGKTAYRTFSDFRATCEGNGGILNVPKWQMNFANGTLRGTAGFDIRESTSKPFSLTFQADQIKMQRLTLSDWEGMRVEGNLLAEGHMDWKLSPKRENHGVYKSGSIEVRVHNGVVHKFEVLSKIFSLINLGSIVRGRLPDVFGQGLPFQKLTWNMEVFDNKWKIKGLKLESDAAYIESSGMYFSGQDRMDFKVQVSPLVGLDTIMSGLFGNLLTKDGKTLTTAFRVRGSPTLPDVRPELGLEPFEDARSPK